MKKLLLIFILGVSTPWILSAKTQAPQTMNGSTLGKYRKPGAPVDIEYTVQKVQSGEPCAVEIRLITPEKSGTMQVKLKLDKALSLLDNFNIKQYLILDGSTTYPLTFKVIGTSEGVYYIRVQVQMEKRGFRVFAVPVQIGNGTIQLKRKPLRKNKQGENISVSHAQEKILEQK
jgi:hypothetical protein